MADIVWQLFQDTDTMHPIDEIWYDEVQYTERTH